jgi:hypothetical protein
VVKSFAAKLRPPYTTEVEIPLRLRRFGDQRERFGLTRAAARIWLATLPPYDRLRKTDVDPDRQTEKM